MKKISDRKMIERVRASYAREVRAIDLDLRLMRRIETHINWLLNRDSNCGGAGSLCNAIQVLIKQAIEYHLRDRSNAAMYALTGKLQVPDLKAMRTRRGKS